MANVSIRNLQIQLGANKVIDALDLEVDAGEFIVLLGPSGCGKSTLLHSIAGLNDAAGGQIRIGGRDMTYADPKDRGIALVFQSYALYPTMNVERNMSFGLRINGTPKAEIERRVARAAEMLQLGPLLKRKPAELSGGQRQRVAIGRAIVRQADVFLFDEPLSNLDAKLRTELRRELKTLHRQLGATMIYVTHDQVEAMTLADRMAVMKGGVIQQFDTPDAIYRAPENLFVATFLGSPGMNLFEGRIDTRGGLRFVTEHMALDVAHYPFRQPPTDGQRVVLGVRPEDVDVAADGHADGFYRAPVALVEAMGAHRVVWHSFHGTQVAAIVQDDRPGGAFALRGGQISLFDATTTQRL
ncbi:carbohydrate ABC transporter ATP-binding protein, CUT1 family (TC 3.A.1.1.-) [Pseudoduganella flava]|uniref:ATP-binding cassette domain-containing protein n=1 Tax=Pseudoduganella flava TaxID=871742 RepID=A0A562PI52_9BURK|nr:ABC transporter ATP-binding protein [Pseudoduganella flava]QGZ42791.1 ATP-binding cassette domain-containing protein [Pseudoduganella flava]TWI44109.1 carbohydrate ABC transporter ATP-binding protein, CUT1 family (TC 3.A.1.1.-) [Pseudoduganella flava]